MLYVINRGLKVLKEVIKINSLINCKATYTNQSGKTVKVNSTFIIKVHFTRTYSNVRRERPNKSKGNPRENGNNGNTYSNMD